MSDVKLSPEGLLEFGTQVYIKAGVPESDARLLADTLVQSDLWNIQSHGVMRMGWYSARLKAGVCNPIAMPLTMVDAGAITVWDGGDALGQVLTERATREAMNRARQYGIGAVSLRNSGHFGAAFYFVRKAASEGFICFLTSNSTADVAPPPCRSDCCTRPSHLPPSGTPIRPRHPAPVPQQPPALHTRRGA